MRMTWTSWCLGGLYSTKQRYWLRDSGGISYTRVHELVLEKLGPDVKQFDMHSLRSGEVSAAVNAGVPDGLLKRHDRCMAPRDCQRL